MANTKKQEELIMKIESKVVDLYKDINIDYNKTNIPISISLASDMLKHIAKEILSSMLRNMDTLDKKYSMHAWGAYVSSIITLNLYVNKQNNTNNKLEIDLDSVKSYFIKDGKNISDVLYKYTFETITEPISFEDMTILFNYCIYKAYLMHVDLLYYSYYQLSKMKK